MADRPRLRDIGPADPVAAFLATAEYAILQAPKGTEGAGENLISAGTYYTPRLFAAVQKVVALHAPVSRGRVMNCCRGCEEENGEFHEDCCHEWPCPTSEAISRALLGEGETGG